MLLLSRKRSERIVIGEDVTVMVVDIRGDKTRLGIDAPNHLAVHRQEVYDAILKSSGHPPRPRYRMLAFQASTGCDVEVVLELPAGALPGDLTSAVQELKASLHAEVLLLAAGQESAFTRCPSLAGGAA